MERFRPPAADDCRHRATAPALPQLGHPCLRLAFAVPFALRADYVVRATPATPSACRLDPPLYLEGASANAIRGKVRPETASALRLRACDVDQPGLAYMCADSG